ncbi:MAG TPA: Mov34/MPN/PAD-1 family protein [Thermoplasmata archaeon]|nr:Mov34/MPN/PAD-1 family protein [Thermoplasmata archaeon]
MPIFRPHRKRPPGAQRIGATPTRITRHALDSALASARSAYPNEFGGVLRAEPPGVISELLLIPGGTAGRRHANFHLYMLPADLSVTGTVHSHPSGALHPSEADLMLFRGWGRRHLILGAPYGPGAWRAYDGNGREVRLEVIDAFAPPGDEAPLRAYRPHVVHREDERPAADDEFPADEA